MDKNRQKGYRQLFPCIDISKATLSFVDKLLICQHYHPNGNYQNEDLLNYIDTLDSAFPPVGYFDKQLRRRFNPDGTPRGSKRTIQYWVVRGWSERDAELLISKLQSRNSQRSVSYWTHRGYTKEEALVKVSDVQSQSAKKLHSVIFARHGAAVNSPRVAEFYEYRGSSREEAEILAAEFNKTTSAKGAQRSVEVMENDQEWYRRQCRRYVEYWLSRGYDISDFEDYMRERYRGSKNYRSKAADNFVSTLATYFPDHQLYMLDDEYGKYIPGFGYVKYDYVDLNKMVIVEYHGRYWHTGETAEYKDKVKQQFAEDLGFTYFVVWDDEINDNTLPSLVQKIKEL